MTTQAGIALDSDTARHQYGPWAVIAGASDGTGEAYARQLAAVGINVLLVARRKDALDALAADLRASHGIETRILVQDLMEADAAPNMIVAAADLEVGCYVSNAGADGTGARFFDQPAERWRRMEVMNVTTLTQAIHAFGGKMVERGRGGIVIMSSGAGLVGTPYLSMYSATKAFGLVLAEALWGELQGTGVNLVGVVAPSMATPFFLKNVAGEDFKIGSSTVHKPEDVAFDGLSALGKHPLIMYASPRRAAPEIIIRSRFEDLQKNLAAGKTYFPKGEKVED